ncbi:MAG: hypothetical protein M1130_03580 [Actinobacteria bacterium]|nr:hypothetical protein [Actinomycetota bacterium]
MKIRDYGIVEDDLPLRGPWTRREDSSRPAGTGPADYTEGWETAGEGEGVEDSPLRGPWARRQEDPEPREGEGELPRTERERRPAAPEPDAGRRTALVEETIKPDLAAAVPASHCRDVGDVRDNCPGTGRRRAFLQNLCTPKGVYHGIIMAEVLGSRGGRSRRRPY